jgi:cytochrome c
MRSTEICNGRPLEDEKDALDTAAFLTARNKEREARKRTGP